MIGLFSTHFTNLRFWRIGDKNNLIYVTSCKQYFVGLESEIQDILLSIVIFKRSLFYSKWLNTRYFVPTLLIPHFSSHIYTDRFTEANSIDIHWIVDILQIFYNWLIMEHSLHLWQMCLRKLHLDVDCWDFGSNCVP